MERRLAGEQRYTQPVQQMLSCTTGGLETATRMHALYTDAMSHVLPAKARQALASQALLNVHCECYLAAGGCRESYCTARHLVDAFQKLQCVLP